MFDRTIMTTGEYTPPAGWKVPVLLRASVAEILSITSLTLRNREEKGIYPQPQRDLKNNYRVYSVVDVCNLQHITNGKVHLAPILSVLYDKGYTDVVPLQAYLHHCLTIFQSNLEKNLQPEAQPARTYRDDKYRGYYSDDIF